LRLPTLLRISRNELGDDAEFEIASLAGTRTTKADGFLSRAFRTGLEPGEILTRINSPCFGESDRVCLTNLARRRGDFPGGAPGPGNVCARSGFSKVGFPNGPDCVFFSRSGARRPPACAPQLRRANHRAALSADTISDAQCSTGDDLILLRTMKTHATMRCIWRGWLLGRRSAVPPEPTDCHAANTRSQ